jgi:hypothetical protein
MHLSCLPYVLHTLPFLMFLSLPPERYLARSTEQWSSSLCSFLHSHVTTAPRKVQIYSSPYSSNCRCYVLRQIEGTVESKFVTQPGGWGVGMCILWWTASVCYQQMRFFVLMRAHTHVFHANSVFLNAPQMFR